jgi:DNA-binding transcriptional MerR regulator
MLRYYEEQGLLEPSRGTNGYRWYAEPLVDGVLQIRGPLDVGLPLAVVAQILPCLEDPCTIEVSDPRPDLLDTLEGLRAQVQDRIECLTESRDAMTAYLAALRASGTGRSGAAQPR